MSEHPHNTIIRELGGKARVAEWLGLDRQVVTKWHVRGIPAKYWHLVLDMPKASDMQITATTLASAGHGCLDQLKTAHGIVEGK